jgi:hypothetical protein
MLGVMAAITDSACPCFFDRDQAVLLWGADLAEIMPRPSR